jgi:hypothetical protein
VPVVLVVIVAAVVPAAVIVIVVAVVLAVLFLDRLALCPLLLDDAHVAVTVDVGVLLQLDVVLAVIVGGFFVAALSVRFVIVGVVSRRRLVGIGIALRGRGRAAAPATRAALRRTGDWLDLGVIDLGGVGGASCIAASTAPIVGAIAAAIVDAVSAATVVAAAIIATVASVAP